MLASKADIIAHESLGFSHVVYRGESYFVNLDLESSRLKFKEYLEKETGKEWGIVKLERYVFYIKDMYNLVGSFLELNDTFRGKVEVPINAISCNSMFFNKNLEGIDFCDFDTSGIKYMNNMFSGCAFPEGFSLGDKFDTASVEDMCGMFNGCTFSGGFSLGDMFDTSSVKAMFCMFSRCDFPEGFSLGTKFDTSSVEDMGFMFNNTQFNEGFSLGNRFDTSMVEKMRFMFSVTKFNEDFRLARNFTICKKSEGMFDNAKLPNRVIKKLGREASDEDIVELLKSDLVTKADFF